MKSSVRPRTREPLLAFLRRNLSRCQHGLRKIAGGKMGLSTTQRWEGDAFDAAHRVDTAEFTPIGTLRTVGDHRKEGFDYVPIQVAEMEAALAALPVAYERFVFVDLGSGKGRAVFLASRLPFSQITGVEFAPALVEVAKRNAVRFQDASQRCFNLRFVCQDATEYELPPQPFVLFFYNPFSTEVMTQVVQRTLESLRSHPREAYVLYANPQHAAPWLEAGFTIITRGPTFLLLQPAADSH